VPDSEQVMADLDSAVKWAGSNGGNLKRVGIGFAGDGHRLAGNTPAEQKTTGRV
jgi:hypothetical protein